MYHLLVTPPTPPVASHTHFCTVLNHILVHILNHVLVHVLNHILVHVLDHISVHVPNHILVHVPRRGSVPYPDMVEYLWYWAKFGTQPHLSTVLNHISVRYSTISRYMFYYFFTKIAHNTLKHIINNNKHIKISLHFLRHNLSYLEPVLWYFGSKKETYHPPSIMYSH